MYAAGGRCTSMYVLRLLATGMRASEIVQDVFHGEGQLYIAVAVLGGSRTKLSPRRRTFILFAYCKVPHYQLSDRQLHEDPSRHLLQDVATRSRALQERQFQSWRPLVVRRQFTYLSTSSSSIISRCRGTCQAEKTETFPPSKMRCLHA